LKFWCNKWKILYNRCGIYKFIGKDYGRNEPTSSYKQKTPRMWGFLFTVKSQVVLLSWHHTFLEGF